MSSGRAHAALAATAALTLALGLFSAWRSARPSATPAAARPSVPAGTLRTAVPAGTPRTPEGTYDAAVLDAGKRRKLAEVMADAAPGSWSRRAAAASAELGYAELTGSWSAYEDADRSLTEAFRVARSSIDSESVGPLLFKAQLSYELHRMQPALDSLRVPEKQAEFFHDQKLLAEITSLRGAVTFALGRYDEGISLLRRSIELDGAPGHKQRLAIALASVGGDDEAERIFAEIDDQPMAPQARAMVELQRGRMALARGLRGHARTHLLLARALFPGFWQIEEQLAGLDAEEGNVERAIGSYRALVAKTEDPELIDALARLLADRDPEEARRLVERSSAILEARLASLPEASYGHALKHFLRMGPDPSRAVDLAERNRALRPNGEARTRLAQAYVRAGRIAEAREEARRVLESPWVSGESYATAAVVLRLAGDAAATTLEAKARAINPHAMEGIDWLKPG